MAFISIGKDSIIFIVLLRFSMLFSPPPLYLFKSWHHFNKLPFNNFHFCFFLFCIFLLDFMENVLCCLFAFDSNENWLIFLERFYLKRVLLEMKLMFLLFFCLFFWVAIFNNEENILFLFLHSITLLEILHGFIPATYTEENMFTDVIVK